MILALIVAACIGFIFFSKNLFLGKNLYLLNNWVEMRLANLRKMQNSTSTDTFSYLTNNNVTKPTMLLLHGFSADKTIWLKFAKHASKDFHLIIPDFMGHGDNSYSANDNYSAFVQTNYLRRLICALGIQGPLTIVGNSMGGMIGAIMNDESIHNTLLLKDKKTTTKDGQQVADDHFNSTITIDSLVLIDPAGAKGEFAIQTIASAINPFDHETMKVSLDFYKHVMSKPPIMPPSVLAYMLHSNYVNKRKQYQHMFADFFNPSEFFDQVMQSRSQNNLLIWGEQDQLLPVTEIKLWEQLLPCQTHIFPHIGHMPMVECPKETYSIIKSTVSR